MKINKIITILSTFTLLFGIAACSNPSNTDSSNSGKTKESSPADEPENNEPFIRSGCSITIPSAQYFKPFMTERIWEINVAKCYESDSYKVVIESNPGNIQLSLAEYNAREQQIELYTEQEGVIGITLLNETANVKSNICLVTFSTNNNSGSGQEQGGQGGGNSGSGEGGGGGVIANPTAASFIGTWKTSDQYLVDTIIFNSDGSGEQYNSNYPTSRTNITWSVTNTSTIQLSGEGSSCTATYSFSADLQTLRLTNFWDYSTPLTFIRQ